MSIAQPPSGTDISAGRRSGQDAVDYCRSGARQILFYSALVMICLLPAMKRASGQNRVPTEYEVKAAFLFNFVKFVEWPEGALGQPGSPITIGIVGSDPYGSILDHALQGKVVQGRSLVLKRFVSIEELESCQVLFIGTSDPEEIQRVLKATSRWSVLTVGDGEAFTQQGGIIGFRMENTVVRFDINADASDRARLRIDSRLLSLARLVKTNPGR